MPLLAVLLVNLAGGFAALLVAMLGRKLAVAAAAVAALGVVTGVLLLGFNTLLAPLVANMFSTAYGQVIGLAFPPVAGTCLAAIASTWAGCTLYKWQVTAIKLAASA